MASQLGFLYSANRTSEKPFETILQTSFGPSASPRLWETMKGREWARWNRMSWREQGLEEVAQALSGLAASAEHTAQNGDAPSEEIEQGQAEEAAGVDEQKRTLSGPILPPTVRPDHTLVYLSADSDEELTTLREDEIYIVGGIVDRNRYKVDIDWVV